MGAHFAQHLPGLQIPKMNRIDRGLRREEFRGSFAGDGVASVHGYSPHAQPSRGADACDLICTIQIPHPHSIVIGSCEKAATFRTNHSRSHVSLMTVETVELLTAVEIPENLGEIKA